MRIIKNYAYIWDMKERLNLTIDGRLLDAMKNYAASKQTSVSELVENYFKTVTRPVRRKSIIDLVDKLDSPGIAPETDLKELFYKEQRKKYGF
jgi:hypothetical protein